MKGAHSIPRVGRMACSGSAGCGSAPARASTRGGRRRRPRRRRRRGPVGAAPDDVLVGQIRLVEASPFHGEGYRKAWAKLRVEEHRNLSAPVDAGARPPGPAPRGPAARPEGTRRHDHQVTVGEGTASWPSITARPSASACHASFEALEPIRQGVRERFDR